MTGKLLLLALVGLATAIPDAALKLKGKDLADYVNAAQNEWKADHTRAAPAQRAAHLMAIKYTRHPADAEVKQVTLTKEDRAAIPDSFDARQQWPQCTRIGYIRDQSDCGSCWAFAAAEAMSDRVCIASKGAQQPVLAATDPLACCGSYCGYGCEGGYPIRAWNWWVKTGLVTGDGYYEGAGCMPYPIEPCGTHTFNGTVHHHDCFEEADTPSCTKRCQNGYPTPYAQDKVFGKSAYAVPANEAAIQKELMTNGPVEAAFTVYSDFMHYTTGVYHHTAGGVEGGHAVKILGWGVESGTKYWLVANSWNNDWGLDGYFKIRRGNDECGMESGIVAGLPKL